MEELIDFDSFVINFPLWYPAHAIVEADGLIQAKSTMGQIGTPVFTDQDLAETFMELFPELQHQYVLRAIPDIVSFSRFLGICEKRGIDHISFDSSGRRGSRYFPIQMLRHDIQERTETPDSEFD